MWSSVLFQGKWKHACWGAHWSRGAVRVVTPSAFSFVPHSLPANRHLGLRVSALTTPWNHQARPPHLDTHSWKINQHSGRATGMSPLTRDLWPARGSTPRAWQGFVLPVSAPCPTLTKSSCWGEEHGPTPSTSDTMIPAEEFKVAWPASDPVYGNMGTNSSRASLRIPPELHGKTRRCAPVSLGNAVAAFLLSYFTSYLNSWEAFFLSWEAHGGGRISIT